MIVQSAADGDAHFVIAMRQHTSVRRIAGPKLWQRHVRWPLATRADAVHHRAS